ncbi:dTDP-4-dehydrorhamnose 3,5-epimerase family protein [Rhodococcus sp. NPDC058521]|uniref:dTDP-4-dehydrorhamnose 3,5-epimerase family protein n=1 Tax=Rhodococcus sp. NPDC058521 TaxID=3346536 RepID=UPI0036678D46
MRVQTSDLAGILLFLPEPFHDERGFFTRTFDTETFDRAVAEHSTDAVDNNARAARFVQDSQSRSSRGVIRGMHGRRGAGEAKLVRCARGAVHDVVVDARPQSPTFGESRAFVLDDSTFAHLFIPPGFLHGFQVLSEVADVCYRIDRAHDSSEDIAVAYDDRDLAIDWPSAPTVMSERDRNAGTWHEVRSLLT